MFGNFGGAADSSSSRDPFGPRRQTFHQINFDNRLHYSNSANRSKKNSTKNLTNSKSTSKSRQSLLNSSNKLHTSNNNHRGSLILNPNNTNNYNTHNTKSKSGSKLSVFDRFSKSIKRKSVSSHNVILSEQPTHSNLAIPITTNQHQREQGQEEKITSSIKYSNYLHAKSASIIQDKIVHCQISEKKENDTKKLKINGRSCDDVLKYNSKICSEKFGQNDELRCSHVQRDWANFILFYFFIYFFLFISFRDLNL